MAASPPSMQEPPVNLIVITLTFAQLFTLSSLHIISLGPDNNHPKKISRIGTL